jgi:regulatory protein YycI of two-component signal transduction system YycFG
MIRPISRIYIAQTAPHKKSNTDTKVIVSGSSHVRDSIKQENIIIQADMLHMAVTGVQTAATSHRYHQTRKWPPLPSAFTESLSLLANANENGPLEY